MEIIIIIIMGLLLQSLNIPQKNHSSYDGGSA